MEETTVSEVASTEEATTTQAEAPSWYYRAPGEDSDGIGGAGDVPDWFKVDKYKSIEEQAKAYPELAKRFGGFDGSPEDYSMPENLEGIEINEGILDIFKAVGKENHMSQAMFSDVISKVAEYEQQQADKMFEQSMQQLGENAEGRIQNINNWLNTNAPKDIVEKMVGLAQNADAVEAMEWMINRTKSAPVADNNAQPATKMSKADYADMLMATDGNGNLRVAVDPEYKRQVDELTKQFQ